VRVDEVRREDVLDRQDRGAGGAGAVAERRARDLEVARGERRRALVDDLADAGEELLVGLGDVAADDDHAGVERVDEAGQDVAEHAPALAHEADDLHLVGARE
jgi:hypothetical protein